MLLVNTAFMLQAQNYNWANKRFRKRSENTIVHSVNLSVGVYSPKMDYWNDIFLPASGSDGEFKSGLLLGGNITFRIVEEFRARVGATFWSDEVKESGVGFNRLDISFTRFSAGGFYVPKFASFGDGFQGYAGFEMYYYDIKNELDISSDSGILNSGEQNGHDMAFAPVLGLEKVFGENILVGAEFSYVLGKYKQAEVEESTTFDVSVAGPQFTISVGYKF